MIRDLCAGPGGWDEGLRRLGRDDVEGWEISRDAIATARAAGHRRRIPGDITGHVGRDIDVEGIIGSPECGGLSDAGLKAGRDDLQLVLDLLDCIVQGHDHRGDYLLATNPDGTPRMSDTRSLLLVEPMRHLVHIVGDPRWLVLEQVPAALPAGGAPLRRATGRRPSTRPHP